MALCLLNREVGPVHDIYDHRHFYIDANGGHCVSGLARNAMARFLREYNSGMFLEQHWFTSLMDTKNPSMQGFIVEQLILSTISLNGFNGYKPSKTISYPGKCPTIEWECQEALYLPRSFNFRAIDAVFIKLENSKDKKVAIVAPIQVTIAKNHPDSEEKFFRELWSEWVRILSDYETEFEFVWIKDIKCRSEEKVDQVMRSTRSGKKMVKPSFQRICIPIGEFKGGDIARYLDTARGR